jgi:hypothetical protein
MSQFAETVIPDEIRFAGRDPESSVGSMTSFGAWFPAFAGTLSESRLASAAGGLVRDDELPRRFIRRIWILQIILVLVFSKGK